MLPPKSHSATCSPEFVEIYTVSGGFIFYDLQKYDQTSTKHCISGCWPSKFPGTWHIRHLVLRGGSPKKFFFLLYIIYIYKICIHKWTSCTRFWVGSQNNMVNPSHKLLDVAVVTSIWKIDGVATPLPQKNLNCVRGVRIAKTNTRVPGKRETSACRQTPWYLWEATNCRS